MARLEDLTKGALVQGVLPDRPSYPLSDGETLLYKRVTEYVQDEMNRAERLESKALDHGVELARPHLDEVRRRTQDRVERTTAAVRERLLSEIKHWDHRANQLKDKELAGKLPRSGMNSAKARQRADGLESRLKRRLEELDAEGQISPLPPVLSGGALVIPAGLLASMQATSLPEVADHARERTITERAAVDAVLAAERRMGRTPYEMPPNNKGYDIESKDDDGTLWFIEVKGRVSGAETFCVTRSEVGVGRNKPETHLLASAEVTDEVATGAVRPPGLRRRRRPFLQHHQCEPEVETVFRAGRDAVLTRRPAEPPRADRAL